MALFVVEWTEGWGEVIAVHTWEEWTKTHILSRNWFTEGVEARDELDAYMQATTRGANQ